MVSPSNICMYTESYIISEMTLIPLVGILLSSLYVHRMPSRVHVQLLKNPKESLGYFSSSLIPFVIMFQYKNYSKSANLHSNWNLDTVKSWPVCLIDLYVCNMSEMENQHYVKLSWCFTLIMSLNKRSDVLVIKLKLPSKPSAHLSSNVVWNFRWQHVI